MVKSDGDIIIERRPNAHGTTLDDKNTSVVIITFPSGKKGILGSWTTLDLPEGRVHADEATDDQLRAAFRGRPFGIPGIAKVLDDPKGTE